MAIPCPSIWALTPQPPTKRTSGTVASIGDTLREERIRRGQTPAEAARGFGAPKATLHALEAGTVSPGDADAPPREGSLPAHPTGSTSDDPPAQRPQAAGASGPHWVSQG